MTDRPITWTEVVAPLVRKCEIAKMLDGGSAVFNREGAEALGLLLRIMAETLDKAALAPNKDA